MDIGARYFRPFYGFLLVFAVLTALTTRLEAADVCVDDVSDGAADALDCDADCSDPSPDCSLRDAIDKAGAGDRIFFDPSLSGNSIGLTEGNYLITSDLTIEGPGSGNFTISGADDFQIFNLQATVQISGLKMINGRNDGIGGCVFISDSGNVTLDDVIVTNCEIATSGSAGGAGIYNEGSLTITNSTIRDSKLALGSSGSIVGGGIQNTGSLTIRNSSIFGNVAQLGGGIFSGGSTASLILDKVSVTTNISQANDSGGGGIAVSGAGSSAVLTNVTFSGNFAFGTNTIGGGISVNNQGHATLIHCTLAENSADNGGNIGNFNNGTATLVNTLIANATEGGDCTGDVTDDGGSIIEDGSCGLSPSADPNLASLQGFNGLLMHALLSPSPAIDSANIDECADEDQRGVPRPQGPGCDVGAFELEVTPLPTPAATPTPTALPTPSPTPDASATPAPEVEGDGGCSLQFRRNSQAGLPLAWAGLAAGLGAGILRISRKKSGC